MNSLSRIIAQNQAVLGKQCENLGKTTPSDSKIFISYDSKKGWELRTLNVIQLFFRYVFGAYRSTRLEYVIDNWNRYVLEKIEINPKKHLPCPAFVARIRALWAKTYPKKEFPSFEISLTTLNSTATLENFDIKCYPENHTDKANQKFIANDINRNYRPGDIILVEGVIEGEKVDSTHPQMKYIKKGCLVYGWEPLIFKKISEKILRKTREMQNQLLKIYKEFERLLAKTENSAKQDSIQAEKDLQKLLKELIPLYDYYIPNGNKRKSKLKQVEKEISTLFSMFQQRKITLDAFKMRLLAFFSNHFYKYGNSALYKNMTLADVEDIMRTAPIRTDSLNKKIKNHAVKKGKRVFVKNKRIFVIGGTFHLLKGQFKIAELAKMQFPSIEKLHKTLGEYRSIISMPRKAYFQESAQLNPNLRILVRKVT